MLSLARSKHDDWSAGWWNLRRGLAITSQQPDLYLKLVLLYSLPPLAAAGLVLYAPRDTLWYAPLVAILPTGHRLAAHKVIRPQEFARETYISPARVAPVLKSVIDDYAAKVRNHAEARVRC